MIEMHNICIPLLLEKQDFAKNETYHGTYNRWKLRWRCASVEWIWKFWLLKAFVYIDSSVFEVYLKKNPVFLHMYATYYKLTSNSSAYREFWRDLDLVPDCKLVGNLVLPVHRGQLDGNLKHHNITRSTLHLKFTVYRSDQSKCYKFCIDLWYQCFFKYIFSAIKLENTRSTQNNCTPICWIDKYYYLENGEFTPLHLYQQGFTWE